MNAQLGETKLRIADTAGQDVVLEPRSRRRFWGIVIAAAVFLAALAWWALPQLQRWAGASISVPMQRLRLAQVERGDLIRDVSVQGSVVAAVSPTLFAPAAGTITLLVEAGSSVQENQVLATLESPELDSLLDQERSTLARLQVERERQDIETRQQALENRKTVDLAEVTLSAAAREKRRADEGHRIAAISAIDYEKAQDDLKNARLAYDHAVADAELDNERLSFEQRTRDLEVERQQLLVADLERQVGALTLRSPVTGLVGNLLVGQKAAVARNQAVMAVVDLSVFEVEAQVPESYADDLGLGMSAEIRSGTETWAGVLVAVSPEILNNQVTTRIRFANETPPGLRQNQRLTTRILLERRPDVLTLSRGQFLDSGGGRVAYVLDADNMARRRPIQIGARSLSAVEVVSGLSAGETVIVSSIDQFQGAETVRITE